MLDNLLSGPGLFLLICVGLIVLVLVGVVMAINKARSNNNRQPNYSTDDQRFPARDNQSPTTGGVFNRQDDGSLPSRNLPGRSGTLPNQESSGSERPTVDDPEIRSGGGFGKSKPTGRSSSNRRQGGGGFGG